MSLFDALIGHIAPHNCLSCGKEGLLLCATCNSELGNVQPGRCFRCNRLSSQSKTCTTCRRMSKLDHVWIRSEYKGISKEVVHKLKFERAIAAADVIAKALEQAIPNDLTDCILVPIPTATTRRRQRGYDQSVVITRLMSRVSNIPMHQYLVRFGQSRQVGSKKTDRIIQLSDAYRVIHRNKLIGKRVILVDDVLTTGATLESAARILREAGVKQVDALVFARA